MPILAQQSKGLREQVQDVDQIIRSFVLSAVTISVESILTLKVPRKIVEQRTIYFCFLFFRENNA